MKLLLPVKPYHINQAFGQNLNGYYAQQGLQGHGGIDMYATHGEPIYASHDGTCYPQVDDHGGNGVVLFAPDTISYNGQDVHYKTIYWHMIKDNAVVHTGQVVKAGDLIGYADSTGLSTGNHLHFGLIPCDSTNSNNLFPTNGYNGAIDPAPYLSTEYAQDINNKNPIPTSVLRIGAWNNDVKTLQTLLNAQNCPCGVVDGVFGVKTLSALKQYQTIHNLTPDGVCGNLTWGKLFAN